jgi:hypothetical protein
LKNKKPNGICSHKINISEITEITEIGKEVTNWIKMAFDSAD